MRELLDYCKNTMPERTFPAGHLVLAEGERAGVLYVLAEGSVEIVKADYQINVIENPGALFGEISVLLDAPHTATVKTVTESRFYVVEDPIAFLCARPEIALAVSKLLAQRLNAMTTYLVDLKDQFEDAEGHLGMIDEVLDTLTHAQGDEHTPGSDRDPDPTVY